MCIMGAALTGCSSYGWGDQPAGVHCPINGEELRGCLSSQNCQGASGFSKGVFGTRLALVCG